MKVFKFGGASIKHASAIKNMCSIISEHAHEPLVVVVSAIGKTTNALEAILHTKNSPGEMKSGIKQLRNEHLSIIEELFDQTHPIQEVVKTIFEALSDTLEKNYPYNQLYDQVVSKGELLSSQIIAAYLNEIKVPTKWVDACKYIRTNNNFREGEVNWQLTAELIKHDIPSLAKTSCIVTQGFVGRSENNFTTTLGREGSDFSAAIFACCLDAESLTVWKDVPGILNADPKLIPEAILFEELPYKEAAEMTYYGASVIHPKTIKPLANKGIPLYVRSFDHPAASGTVIHGCDMTELIPAIIIKNNQCLVTFQVLDYTFINENNLSLIFKKMAESGVKINIMQNSAISFSIAIDYDAEKLETLTDSLKDDFDIRYNTGLKLITLKNYTQELIDKYRGNEKILLEQISRGNYRALVHP